jgi:hypothetical protein
MTNRAPLIAAVLMLVLPVLYIGSYLALVTPPNHSLIHMSAIVVASLPPYPLPLHISPYRYGGRVAEFVFWPLEQVDRRVRPDAWEFEWDPMDFTSWLHSSMIMGSSTEGALDTRKVSEMVMGSEALAS